MRRIIVKNKHQIRTLVLFNVWHSMLYVDGVENVCDEWHNFTKFCEDVKHPPTDKHRLRRKNINRKWSRKNSLWVVYPYIMQNRRDYRLVKFNHDMKPLCEWCEDLDLSYTTISNRLNGLGWSEETALNTPTNKGFKGTMGKAHFTKKAV